MRQKSFVEKAERHLDEVLNLPNIGQAMGAFGPIFEKHETFTRKKLKNGKFKRVKHVDKVPVMVAQVAVIKQKTEAAKLVLPAYAKALYGKSAGPTVKFSFNMGDAKAKYAA